MIPNGLGKYPTEKEKRATLHTGAKANLNLNLKNL